jgi:hypothetical protein
MDTEYLESSRREKKRVEERLRQLEMPVDFDQLCRDGVLEKTGTKTFRIPDPKRLPDHVAVRLEVTETTTTTKKGSASRSVTECTGELVDEAALKGELLQMKKLLGQIINELARLSKRL